MLNEQKINVRKNPAKAKPGFIKLNLLSFAVIGLIFALLCYQIGREVGDSLVVPAAATDNSTTQGETVADDDENVTVEPAVTALPTINAGEFSATVFQSGANYLAGFATKNPPTVTPAPSTAPATTTAAPVKQQTTVAQPKQVATAAKPVQQNPVNNNPAPATSNPVAPPQNQATSVPPAPANTTAAPPPPANTTAAPPPPANTTAAPAPKQTTAAPPPPPANTTAAPPPPAPKTTAAPPPPPKTTTKAS